MVNRWLLGLYFAFLAPLCDLLIGVLKSPP